LLIASVSPAIGWDDVGHRITGYIAWQRMSQRARENVIRILRAAPEDSHLSAFYMQYGPKSDELKRLEFFMFVPTWADMVRDRAFETRYRKYHRGNWHYDDTFWRQVSGRAEILSGFEEGGEAVPRMAEFDKRMRDGSASNAEKAIAIAWMMHLGGDIHQPLHTSARVTETEPKGDQGGNLFSLTPPGTSQADRVNLHWFWDSIVGRNVPFSDATFERHYIEGISRSMIRKYPFASLQNGLKLGQYQEWQKESFGHNMTTVFTPDLKRNEMPSARYKKNAFRLAERQLALAGYRLGETLNSIFDVPPVSGR
jgi:hypothetical protein